MLATRRSGKYPTGIKRRGSCQNASLDDSLSSIL
jgi:hypothetical protein